MTAAPIGTRKAAAAFRAIVDKVGRDDVAEILFNWDDYELSDDGDKIVSYVGRDREYSRGADGGKATVSKREFLAWLLSDSPFDEKVYGKDIRQNTDWVNKIKSARAATGLSLGKPPSP